MSKKAVKVDPRIALLKELQLRRFTGEYNTEVASAKAQLDHKLWLVEAGLGHLAEYNETAYLQFPYRYTGEEVVQLYAKTAKDAEVAGMKKALRKAPFRVECSR